MFTRHEGFNQWDELIDHSLCELIMNHGLRKIDFLFTCAEGQRDSEEDVAVKAIYANIIIAHHKRMLILQRVCSWIYQLKEDVWEK